MTTLNLSSSQESEILEHIKKQKKGKIEKDGGTTNTAYWVLVI